MSFRARATAGSHAKIRSEVSFGTDGEARRFARTIIIGEEARPGPEHFRHPLRAPSSTGAVEDRTRPHVASALQADIVGALSPKRSRT